MTSVNLKVTGVDTFGARLPTVFFTKIEINTSSAIAGGIVGAGTTLTGISINTEFNIKFTKPAHLQNTSTEDFIKNQINDLKLYAYITNQHLTFIPALENETMSILEFQEYIDDNDDTWSESGSDVSFEVRLKDLIDPPETEDYGASLILNNSFDEKGDEIIELASISHVFKLHAGELGVESIPAISDSPKITLLAMVGLDRDLHQDPTTKTFGFSGAEAAALPAASEPASSLGSYLGSAATAPYRNSFSNLFGESRNNTLYNKYFGNISYINVLEFGEVPSQFYKQFSRPDGTAYLNLVMQSINGKFYSTDNYSFNDIQNSFKALFEQFSQDREADSRLNKNMSDLEAIVYSEKNKTNVLGEIANYRSTYPNKEQNTASGRFYNSFIVVYAEVLQNVHAQDELTQKLYFDSLIVDSRGVITGVYEKPSKIVSGFKSYADTGWVDNIVYEENYIPHSWFNCTRTAHSVESLFSTSEYYKFYSTPGEPGGLTEALLESALNGLPASAFEDPIETASTAMDAGYKYANDEYEDIYNFYYSAFVSDYPEDVAAEMAAAEVEYIISAGDGTNIQQIENNLERSLLGSDGPSADENFVIHNTGWWLFDYEKAIRYKSKFSQYIDLSKMQRYFRYNIPYNNFKIMGAQMQRRENELPSMAVRSDVATNGSFDPSASYGVIYCTFFADFIQEKTEDFRTGMGTVGDASDVGTMGKRTYYHLDADGGASPSSLDATQGSKSDVPLQIKTGLKWENVSAEAMAVDPLAEDVHKFKYMRPAAKDNFYGELLTTHLKFKLFDLANSNYSKRFEGLNDLGSGASPDTMGPIYDGYRLACFEFSDLMDDDVAYYNSTTEGQSAIGNPALANAEVISGVADISSEESVTTVYRTGVRVEDSTLRLINSVLNDLEVIIDEYADYVESAIEVCSFNNITNSYNSFFVGAINEKYLESKPWVKAAYYSIAYLDIFYGTFGDAFDSEVFDQKVLSLLMRISPETGNLESTTALLVELRAMFDSVKNQILNDIEETYGITREDINKDSTVICFGNIFPIAGAISPTHHSQIIYGDYFPFSENDTSFSKRDAAPLVIIPEAAYFGGAYAEITTVTFDTSSEDSSVPIGAEAATSFDLIDSGLTLADFRALSDIYGTTQAAAYLSEFYNRLYGGFVGETAIRQIAADDVGGLGRDAPSIIKTADDKLKFNLGFDLETVSDDAIFGTGRFAGSTKEVSVYDPMDPITHRVAFDEIFMPFSANDWRFSALGFRASSYATDGVIIVGVDEDEAGGSSGPAPVDKYPFRWTESDMDLAVGYGDTTWSDHNIHKLDPTSGTGSTLGRHTSLARFAHEMLQRSTSDVRVTFSGGGYKGQAKTSGLGVGNRRPLRTLGDLLALIQNVYLPEAQRRISTIDDKIYSNITKYRQRAYMLDTFGYNAESGMSDTLEVNYFEGSFGPYATPMDYRGTDVAGNFASLSFQNNVDPGFLGTIWSVAVREMLLTMQDLIIDQMNSPTPEGADRTYATRGLSKVVSATNYPGASSFVSPLEAPPDYDYTKGTGRESDYELFGISEYSGTDIYEGGVAEVSDSAISVLEGFIDID